MENLKSRLEVLACIVGQSSELVSSFTGNTEDFEMALLDVVCDELSVISSDLKKSENVHTQNNITIHQFEHGTINISNK